MTTTAPSGMDIATGWSADKNYSISFSTVNRLITGLYGAIAPFADIIHSNENTENHYIGTLTENMYKVISESILNPSHLSFWMPDNTLRVRKAVVDFGPNTYLDGKRKAIVGVNNIITLIPKIVDINGTVWPDVTEVQIKNLQKLDFPMSINGADASDYKVTSTNGTPITFALNKLGRATVRIKAMVPELSDVWISVYPELIGYNDAQMADFNTWLASQPK
jgi:hypothetical protein